MIGGPGSFFLEAGRDAGPFLNSAVTNGFETQGTTVVGTGEEVWGGGILSVGNDWNPWLAAKGSDLYVEFGVGNGQDFDALRDYYLDPANLPNLDGDLFVQIKDGAGNSMPDRNQPIYAPVLIDWLQKNQSQVLESLYGTTAVTFQQAYDAFKTLPDLVQRVFMLGSVYFNELIQTSIPSGPSFKQYSRGYQAVNLLFPAALGYTANDLERRLERRQPDGRNRRSRPAPCHDPDFAWRQHLHPWARRARACRFDRTNLRAGRAAHL